MYLYNIDIINLILYGNPMIIYDVEKANKLKIDRDIDINEIIEIITQKKYIKIMKNPKRKGQQIFIIFYKNYIHVVPFVIDDAENVVVKTVFPSRYFHKIYKEKMK